MLTPFDKRQQAAERRAAQARRELQGAELGLYTIPPSCDWDAELTKLAAPKDGPS